MNRHHLLGRDRDRFARPISKSLRVFLRVALGVVALLGVAPFDPSPRGQVLAAGVCAPAPEHLATVGTTAMTSDGGIGGTGKSADDNEGGIGGTGIVGTITGFASVCVNGVEVHYDDHVPVSENGQPSSVSALAVGQVVALDAGRGARGLTARKIEVVYALEGPVTHRTPGKLEVMGAGVIAAETSMRAGLEAFNPGDWVQVSGHRDGQGQWVATRVAKIEARREVTLQGGVEASDKIAGVHIELAVGTGPALGEERLVRGEWVLTGSDGGKGRVRVREMAVTGAERVLSRADRVIVETRVRENKAGRVRTGHAELDKVLAGQDLREGQLVRVRAHRSADGHLVTERVERSRASPPGGVDQRDHRKGRGNDDGNDKSDGRSGRDHDRDRDRVSGREWNDNDRSGRDRSVREDRSAGVERIERPPRAERTDRPERAERVERPDRQGRD